MIREKIQDLLKEVWSFTKKIAFLEIEGDQKRAQALILPDIPTKGLRLWFLLTSCIIASIGLNTNSSAVIIGAMLISPLMGPILGLGFGLAVASKKTIRISIQNIFFSVSISLALATLYFFISPFQDATPEILSRTAPNLLDLIVAIAAGFAGVVAMNSTSLSGAIPGVAIATAIMPPLCASAYGIAHGDFKIALGAFYLFFVNAVAIAVVAFLLFKRLHFSQDAEELTENTRLKPTVISLAVLLIVAPLVWSLWDAWRANYINRSMAKLVQSYHDKLEIVSWSWNTAKNKKLILYNFKKADPQTKRELEADLHQIQVTGSLELHENTASPEMEELANQMKSSQMSALMGNPKIVQGLIKLASSETGSVDTLEKLRSSEAELATLAGAENGVKVFFRVNSKKPETLVLIQPKNNSERNRMKSQSKYFQDWLKKKIAEDSVVKVEVK